MIVSLLFGALWFLAAAAVALRPVAGAQWSAVYALMASGIPILGLLVLELGPLVGLTGLVAGAFAIRSDLVAGARGLA